MRNARRHDPERAEQRKAAHDQPEQEGANHAPAPATPDDSHVTAQLIAGRSIRCCERALAFDQAARHVVRDRFDHLLDVG
jgi:hypothetical protein